MEVALSLGSNLGDRLAHLVDARRLIEALPGARTLAASPVYETEPVGVPPQYARLAFLNAILLIDSSLPLEKFARFIHRIEDDLGRVRSDDRNAPRAIDIDIIAAGAEHRNREPLIVPHARWRERRFVVQPLCDVRPDWILPGETQTVREILERLPRVPAVRQYRAEWSPCAEVDGQ
jgi:2-amino-4-hydroxy-6-hydroxymethyldihydropteridine diphosphokinase